MNYPTGLVWWIGSYLINRFQKLKIYDNYGEIKFTSSSVPQGSGLGPTLFSIYLAPLHSVSSNSLLVKFADDLNLAVIYYKNSLAEDNNLAKKEIVNIKNWVSVNGLTINDDKTKQLTCAKNKIILPTTSMEEADSLRILGIIFQKNLNWNLHFKNITTSATKRLYALKVLKKFVSSEQLAKVFTAC